MEVKRVRHKGKFASNAIVTIPEKPIIIPFLGVYQYHHGSLNVPIDITQPLGIWSIMATIR